MEEGLVDAVLEDGGSEPAALPLVSHAMAETWRRRDGDTLTLAGYREAGGVAGSISTTADALYKTVFDEAQQHACRRLMLQLVVPGEGTSDTRRRLAMRTLDSAHDAEIMRRVAPEMIDARLLTVDRDSLEIAHEALLRSWPRLRGWIDEARDDLRIRQRVAYAAAEWEAQDRDPDLLYRGTPLQAVLDWAEEHANELWPSEEGFLAASREASLRASAQAEEAARRSRRLRRIAVAILATLAVAAAGASVVAFSALGQARARYGEALAGQATFLAGDDPRRAITFALEAAARGQAGSIETRIALVDASQALADMPYVPQGAPVPVGDASSIVVSPDGQIVVTGNRDGSISTWRASGAALAGNVPGHAKAIEEMDLTPDGRTLVTGADDGTVLLWDLADPADVPAPTLLGETGEIVWSVAVAPDGGTAATASEDGSIHLWDLGARSQTPSRFADLHPDALTVAFSPDGELLLAGNGAGEVTGWTLADGRLAIPSFHAHRSDVWEIEFDPSGNRFATASSDGRIQVWDTTTGERPTEPFEGTTADDVRGVLMDDEGRVLAGDEQGRLLVAALDGSTEPVASDPRHATQVVDAALGAGTLATLGMDQKMQVWSPSEPTALTIVEQNAGAFALAASPDGTRIATGDGAGNLRIFSATTGGRELGPLQLGSGRLLSLAFSQDGTRLASGSEDGDVEVIDTTSGEHLASPPRSAKAVNVVLFTDEGLLTAGDAGVVRIWDGEVVVAELTADTDAVAAMAVSPDGVLAVADAGGGVHLWDLSERRQLGEPLDHDNLVGGLAWSADGEILAIALHDERVELVDVSSRTTLHSLTPHPGGALAVTFLDDGVTIATTDRDDGSVRLWDVETGTDLGGALTGHAGAAWGAVSLPGARFATSSEDGTVRIWDVLDQRRACDRARGSIGLLPGVLSKGEERLACVEN